MGEDDGSRSPVVFKLAEDSISVQRSKTFHSIAEDEEDAATDEDEISGQVELRPKSYQRELSLSSQTLSPAAVHRKRPVHLRLKHVQSVPQLSTYPGGAAASAAAISGGGRPWSQAGETMTRDAVFIIPTPEMPAISLRKLPRNYLDTPSIDPLYQPSSTSLTSIQMQNKQRVDDMFNFQMPRYYGHSELYLPTPAISQEEISRSNSRAKQVRVSLKKNRSMVNLNQRSASPDQKSASTHNVMQGTSDGPRMMMAAGSVGSLLVGSDRTEQSKRLKMLRGNLPPLMIQTKDKAPEKERH